MNKRQRKKEKGKYSVWRGHLLKRVKGKWGYMDGWKYSGEPRDCGHCGMGRTVEGHDGCIGTLKDIRIMNACCGHGETRMAYIQYWDRSRIAGQDALNEMSRLINIKKKLNIGE